jgi:hypothetical protein
MEPLMQNSASRRIVGGLAVLAVLVGISAWWVSSRSAAPAQGEDARTPPAAEASEAPAASAPTETAEGAVTPATAAAAEPSPLAGAGLSAASATPANIATAPLPPPDTPLAQVIDELERRARAGDAAASCRLGFELLRCRRSAEAVFQRDMLTDALARSRRPEAAASGARANQAGVENMLVDLAARNDLLAEQAQVMCVGIDPQRYDTPLRWLMRAANAGDATSRAALLRSVDTINQGNTLANLDALAAFRAAAPRWMAEDFEAGTDVALNVAIRFGVQSGYGMLQEALAERPALAYALLQVHDRAPGATERPGAAAGRAALLSRLPPADAAVQAEAAALVARFDAARAAQGLPTAPGSISMSNLGPLMQFDPGIDAAACGREPVAPAPRASG